MKGVSTLFPSTTLKLDVSLVVKEMIIVTRAKDLTYYDTMIRCVQVKIENLATIFTFCTEFYMSSILTGASLEAPVEIGYETHP